MSNQTIIYLVGGGCALAALAAYTAWILVPAWTAYSRWWERLCAAFLSLYVLVAMVAVGLLGGATIVWFYDRWAG